MCFTDNYCSTVREELIAQFRVLIEKDGFLQDQKEDQPRTEAYLRRFLRAGSWDPERSLEVLRAYSSLGAEYTNYISRALPTKSETEIFQNSFHLQVAGWTACGKVTSTQ